MRHRFLRHGCAIILGGSSIVGTLGCGATFFLVPPTAQENLVDNCQVYFRVRSYEEPNPAVESEWQCVQRAGQKFAFPQEIFLKTGETETKARWQADYERYCDKVASKAAADKNKMDETNASVCVWNRLFNDTMPLTFEFSTTNETSAPGTDLSRYIAAVRVVRNGDVAFSWVADQPLPVNHSLTIPGSIIHTDELIPSMSELGIYVLPTGENVNLEALHIETAKERASWQDRLRSGLRNLVTDPMSPIAQGGLTSELQCFQKRTEYISQSLALISNGAHAGGEQDALAELDKWFETTQTQTKQAQAAYDKPTAITLAVSEYVDLQKLPKELDGVALTSLGKTNVDVLLMGQRVAGENKFYKWDGAKLTPDDRSDDQLANVYFSAALGTKNKGRVFSTRNNAVNKGLDVTEAKKSTLCEKPSKLTDDMRDDVKEVFEKYEKKTINKQKLEEELKAAADKVGLAAREELTATLKDAKTAAENYFAKRIREETAKNELIRQQLETIDNLTSVVAVVRAQVDSLPSLLQNVEATVVKVTHDPAAQQQLYNAFARGIGDEKDLFSKRKPNPEAIRGESVLTLKYKDRWQWFFLGAWNGVPIPTWRPAHGYIKYEPRIENAIPIIDGAGFRIQFDHAKAPDLRFAVGVFGTRETRVVVKNTAAGAVEEESPTNFHVGPQVNISIGSIKVGAGYLIREDKALGSEFADVSNIRVLMGLDLIKLFTGTDAAAIKTGDVNLDTNAKP